MTDQTREALIVKLQTELARFSINEADDILQADVNGDIVSLAAVISLLREAEDTPTAKDDPFRGELTVYRRGEFVMGVNAPFVDTTLAAIRSALPFDTEVHDGEDGATENASGFYPEDGGSIPPSPAIPVGEAHAEPLTDTKRAAKIHTLKTWPEYFAAVVDGRKRFELRRNDRDFRVGDCLVLQEFDPTTQTYTREMFSARVTYLTTAYMPDGYVALSIEPWEAMLATQQAALRTMQGRIDRWLTDDNAGYNEAIELLSDLSDELARLLGSEPADK